MFSLLKVTLTLLLSFLLIVFISLFGNLSLEIYLKLGLIFLVSTTIGAVIVQQLSFIDKFSSISFILLSSFLGLFLLSFLTFIDKTIGLFLIGCLWSLSIGYLWLRRKKIAFRYTPHEVSAICLAFACSLLFAFGDTYAFATHLQLPILTLPSDDIYFFTNLVHTLSNGTIYSATYELGTPLNYQFIGYLPAAFITKYVGVPSHLSLYGYLFGLVRFLPFLLVIEWVRSYFLSATYYKWFLLLSPLLFTLLQPLHPLYLLKLSVGNFIWSGLGYIGPSLNIGYSFSFVVVLLCLLIIQNVDRKKSMGEAALFALLLALLVGIKLPVFFSFGCFVFSLALFNAFYKKEYYLLKCITVAMPLTLLLMYSLYFGEKTGSVLSLKYSYFPSYFNSLFHFSGSFMHLKIALGVLLLFFIWGSIRLVFMLYATFKSHSTFKFLNLAAFLSLSICTLLAALFDLKVLEDQGQMIRDVSYDSLQFIRSGFFILNTVAVVAALSFLNSLSGKKIYVTLGILGIWMSLSAISLISNLSITPEERNDWVKESLHELQGYSTKGLLVVNPALYNNHYSTWLTANNPGVFWTSNGGCLTTTKNYYRHELYDALLTQQDFATLNRIKKEGVSLFIATPDDKKYFLQLKQKGMLKQPENSKWLFTFADNKE